jgi:hypothetical protein
MAPIIGKAHGRGTGIFYQNRRLPESHGFPVGLLSRRIVSRKSMDFKLVFNPEE